MERWVLEEQGAVRVPTGTRAKVSRAALAFLAGWTWAAFLVDSIPGNPLSQFRKRVSRCLGAGRFSAPHLPIVTASNQGAGGAGAMPTC
jgi:hypothetical protein